MEQFVFQSDLEKSICREIYSWCEHTLAKPSAFFNNLPACPYALKSFLDQKVAIIFKYDDNFQCVYSAVSQFEGKFDLILVVDLKYNKDPEAFHAYLDQINQAISDGTFIQRDVWLMGFHPDDDEAEYLESEGFEPLVQEEYGLIFIQRLSKVMKASENLKRLGYYQGYGKDYDVDEIFATREDLYRRLKNGDESSKENGHEGLRIRQEAG